MMSFWWLILFLLIELGHSAIIDKFFRKNKKYTNIDGKDSKYTNAIDISSII